MITSLPTKCISAISQWQTFLKSFTHKMAANATLRQNYITVALCIGARRLKRLQFFCQSTFTTDQCSDPHREVDSFEPNDIMTYILGAGSPYLYPEDQGYRSRFKVK